MRILLTLLLLLPMLASADHHRAHAINHLNDANRMLRSTLVHADTLGSSKLRIYTQKYINQVDAAIAALHDPDSDLDNIRRFVNHPNTGESVANGMSSIRAIAITLVVDGNNLLAVRLLLSRQNKAWFSVDRAIWHIQDAIREEIYLDPEFQ